MHFSEKLRQVIGGSTIDEFADVIGTTPQRVKDVLRGKQKAPSDLLVSLHTKLGVDLNWLMDDADKREPVMVLSVRETSLLENYRAAADDGRRAIEQTSAAVTKQKIPAPHVKAKKAA